MFSTIARNSRQTVFKVVKTSKQLQIGKFQNACRRSIHQSHALQETVKVTYIDPMGDSHTVDAEVGKNLLDIAHDNNLELEGACGGELACATCHLVFEQDIYDSLPEKEPEEDDMLDLAMELTDTSRLGCQICVTKDMDGMTVRIPDDGY